MTLVEHLRPGPGLTVRIGLVTYSTRPRGSVVHTLHLAEALARLGQQVEVWALGRSGDKTFYRPVDPAVTTHRHPQRGRRRPLPPGRQPGPHRTGRPGRLAPPPRPALCAGRRRDRAPQGHPRPGGGVRRAVAVPPGSRPGHRRRRDPVRLPGLPYRGRPALPAPRRGARGPRARGRRRSARAGRRCRRPRLPLHQGGLRPGRHGDPRRLGARGDSGPPGAAGGVRLGRHLRLDPGVDGRRPRPGPCSTPTRRWRRPGAAWPPGTPGPPPPAPTCTSTRPCSTVRRAFPDRPPGGHLAFTSEVSDRAT